MNKPVSIRTKSECELVIKISCKSENNVLSTKTELKFLQYQQIVEG